MISLDVGQGHPDAAVAGSSALDVEAGALVCDITDPAAAGAVFARPARSGTVRAVIHAAG
ncbi:hypothetical protein [Nonomuraea sp. NPDC050691]|uniref:hypothetical protein n=1 Tax=Nonomuraea sp. NPDC050691 TaxID=3155661 RepID=UPI0033FDEB06